MKKDKNLIKIENHIKQTNDNLQKEYKEFCNTNVVKDLIKRNVQFDIIIDDRNRIKLNSNMLIFKQFKNFNNVKILAGDFDSDLFIDYYNYSFAIAKCYYTLCFNKIINDIFDKLNKRQQNQIIKWSTDKISHGYKCGKFVPEFLKPYLLFV